MSLSAECTCYSVEFCFSILQNIHSILQEIFVKCCPTCCEAQPRAAQPAGHTPIITAGFGSRGQFDLIDMQSCPDGEFNFLGNYQVKTLYYTYL